MARAIAVHRRMNWPAVILVAGAWALLVNQLRPDWTHNPQYTFGWFVPVLALELFRRRWLDRPAPNPPANSRATLLVLALLAPLFLLTRLMQEANADWGVVNWALAAQVCAFTLALLGRAGGAGWVKHFALPVLFIFTAVPWPREAEHQFVEQLMRSVAGITVELLAIIGIPAVQSGNLIEIGAGVVGVDEACSGVRSLQSTLMVSVFLGELYRFGWLMRAGFLAAGLGLAFTLNVARSFTLAWIAARHGLKALEKFHDPAGFTILVACFFTLWIFGAWLEKRQKAAHVADADISTSETPDALRPEQPRLVAALPRALLIGTAGWIIFSLLAVEAWYRSRESKLIATTSWDVKWPRAHTLFEDVKLEESTRAQIAADEGGAGRWQEADGSRWTMFFFRWQPGPVHTRALARAHRPDYCLPASGRKLTADLGVRTIRADGLDLPFRALVFDDGGRPLHVFFCLWEDRVASTSPSLLSGFTPSSARLKAVWEGQRRALGQQTLEFVVSGHGEIAETEATLRRGIEEMIVARTKQ